LPLRSFQRGGNTMNYRIALAYGIESRSKCHEMDAARWLFRAGCTLKKRRRRPTDDSAR
jgi:hypothetical protein